MEWDGYHPFQPHQPLWGYRGNFAEGTRCSTGMTTETGTWTLNHPMFNLDFSARGWKDEMDEMDG